MSKETTEWDDLGLMPKAFFYAGLAYSKAYRSISRAWSFLSAPVGTRTIFVWVMVIMSVGIGAYVGSAFVALGGILLTALILVGSTGDDG